MFRRWIVTSVIAAAVAGCRGEPRPTPAPDPTRPTRAPKPDVKKAEVPRRNEAGVRV